MFPKSREVSACFQATWICTLQSLCDLGQGVEGIWPGPLDYSIPFCSAHSFPVSVFVEEEMVTTILDVYFLCSSLFGWYFLSAFPLI